MGFYIKIENGQPIDHPADEENLMQVFGEIPLDWETFVRVEQPIPLLYQVLESQEPTYQKINDLWTDVWALRDMTADEKNAKQQAVKDKWMARFQVSNWSAWIFDDSICAYVPPVPRTVTMEDIDIRWCGADNNWKRVPAHPIDGGQYKFDYIAWSWVAVVN